jgi:F-type H+-transporting ATPase subunit c
MLLSIILDAAVSYVPGLAAIAAAIAVIGAGMGIGKIGQSAMEAMARQPEAGDGIRSGMIIAGALVEGATLFAIVVCLLAALG